MIALTWDDVDFANREIHINKTATVIQNGYLIINPPKTKTSYRTIPLTQTALHILKEQKERKVISLQNAQYVFTGDDGEIISNQNYTRTLRYICEKNGIRPVSMHSLRHTFATRCIEAGMLPKTVQTILGHSTLQMTMDRYVEITDREKHKELEEIEAVFSASVV
jgi:integrase